MSRHIALSGFGSGRRVDRFIADNNCTNHAIFDSPHNCLLQFVTLLPATKLSSITNALISRLRERERHYYIIIHDAMPFPDFREMVAKQGIANVWKNMGKNFRAFAFAWN